LIAAASEVARQTDAVDTQRVWTSRWGRLSQSLGTVAIIGFFSFAAIWFATGQWLLGLVVLAFAIWPIQRLFYRIAHELELMDDQLRWRTPRRSGSVRIDDITGARRHAFQWDVLVVEVRDARPVLVWSSRWFDSTGALDWLESWGLVPH
jgi:hypothetical protein